MNQTSTLVKNPPTEIIASSGHGLEEIDSFAVFVDLAIRKNIERSAYFTIKAARKELAKRPENHLLKVTPKESELCANLSRVLKQKCIPQTWRMDAGWGKHNARSVFRNVSLQFESENGVLVSVSSR